jgi:NADH-quinone oxidoreductase subunit J
MYEIIFYILAILCLLSGALVAFTRNIAYAAFSLLCTFFAVSGLYVMLGADFVGVSQLLIYVGGILVLFLFGMMLTSNIDKLREEKIPFAKRFPGLLVSGVLLLVLLLIIWGVPQWQKAVPRELPGNTPTTPIIGQLFMGDYALLFIASSIAILVALVGAAMIARSDRLSPEEAAEKM